MQNFQGLSVSSELPDISYLVVPRACIVSAKPSGISVLDAEFSLNPNSGINL